MRHKKTIGAASVMVAMGAAYYFLGPMEQKPEPSVPVISAPTPEPAETTEATPVSKQKQILESAAKEISREIPREPAPIGRGYARRAYGGDSVGDYVVPPGLMVTMELNSQRGSSAPCIMVDGIPNNIPCYVDHKTDRWHYGRCFDGHDLDVSCQAQKEHDLALLQNK